MADLRVGTVRAAPGQRATGALPVGELDQLSFARGQIDIPLIVVCGARPGPTLGLIAGAHSGEYVGMEAVIAVTRRVDPGQLSGNVVAVPVLNIFGFAARVPYVCPLDNLNMNRLWPGQSGGTVGQRITYAVWHGVASKVDYLIDMHGGDFPEDQADYAICFQTGDAGLDQTSEAMARHYGFPYIRKSPRSEGGAPTGPAARMAMELLHIPAIVSAAGDAGRVDQGRLGRNIAGVENVMRLVGMLPGDPVPPPAGQRAMVSRRSLLASVAGICRTSVAVGDPVREGQQVAEIVDFYGEVRERLDAPCDGMVAQLFYQSATNPGNIVMKIGQLGE